MSIDEINAYIEEFKDTHLPENFIWRNGQKEIIIETLKTYFSKTHKFVILDCPTGSGKSIIAMCISYVLNKDKKRGYILASDLALQEQYEKDITKFNLKYGSVKGIDNYLCTDNMEVHSLGTCKIKNLKPITMRCYQQCPYFSARDYAAETKTSVLNYAYWLIMMNYVAERVDTPPFSPRDFTICDEAHKLMSIVQNHFSPRFDSYTLDKLDKLTKFFNTYNLGNLNKQYKLLSAYIKSLYKEDNVEILHKTLIKIEDELEKYFSGVELLRSSAKKYKIVPKSWKYALNLSDWLKDMHCKIEDYNAIIESTSIDYLIKNPGNDSITFNCIEERYLINKYFHQWNSFTVLMSATFANGSKYANSIALKNAKYIKLKSNFDFTESPIFYYNKRKMTYTEIEKNIPWLIKKIEDIINSHPNDHGLIHSVSYDLALKIYNGVNANIRKRLLIYNGTEEKKQVIDLLNENNNTIIMGPSLLEGLDLKDDMSRFQIFPKVPYLSLSDKFVVAKMNINDDWYREQAILSILQGVGRSIRSTTDWAKTYILDASFGDLMHYNRKSFPEEFTKRLIIVDE